MRIAFYGSSLLSSYWNGAATYYRGLLKALAALGYQITFYEPDAFDRQAHRDIDPPTWCAVDVYQATPQGMKTAAGHAARADIVVKASGVGFEDDLLLEELMRSALPDSLRIFWDVDAPATLAQIQCDDAHPLRHALPLLDAVLTYGGGDPVTERYISLGAKSCTAIYNAVDPDTHHPVAKTKEFSADLAFLGNRLPDREARVDDFFLRPAYLTPSKRFLLGGAGWGNRMRPANVHWLDHVPTRDHNAFNSSPLAVLNITRDSMAANGYAPPTRVFEAAGCGACLITDAWDGVDYFLTPGAEVLVARDGADVTEILTTLTPDSARSIGMAALRRVRREHTYAQRAKIVDETLRSLFSRRQGARA